MTTAETAPLLSIRGLTKAYPGVVANADVALDIAAGGIHALLGENGAGKSTLVKMIYGLVHPDAGTMQFAGGAFAPQSPQEARRTGVAMVFQHFSLFDALTVAENVALGMDNPPKPAELAQEISAVSNEYGLPLNPDRRVGDLSAGERQRVEIIRCLLQDPKLLIMDEPTSVLTPQEVEILFDTLRKLSEAGTSILYISHKLEEIRSLCDAATILRLGRVVAECDPRQTSAAEMAELMVGTRLTQPTRARPATGETLIEIKSLSASPVSQFGTPLREISFAVQSGEILGIGGVAGNGQDELLAVLSGETAAPRGTLTALGGDVGHLGPNARRKLGILAAPEERLGHAAAPDMSLTENAVLTGTVRMGLARRGFIDWQLAARFADEVIEGFDVRTPGPANAARSLSGGNLQKYVIGREILQKPSVLAVNQPTWGVDASAAAAIRQALLDLADAGCAVIVISQDLDELLEISDRFAALNEGRLSQPRPTAELDMASIGLMMGGAHGMEVAHVSH